MKMEPGKGGKKAESDLVRGPVAEVSQFRGVCIIADAVEAGGGWRRGALWGLPQFTLFFDQS